MFTGNMAVQSICGEIPEWPKGTDCKSVAECFRGSNPLLPTITPAHIAQRQSTSLVKKRSWVRFPVWAGLSVHPPTPRLYLHEAVSELAQRAASKWTRPPRCADV